MRGARPLREPRRQNLLHVLRGQLAHQSDGLGGLGCGSRLQSFDKALSGVFSQVADDRYQQVAVLAEPAMPESIGDVVDRGLGHQAEDIHHPVRDLAAAHRLFDKFRQPLFRADARPQTLRRTWPLSLHALQRRERLLHGRVAPFGGCLLAQSHEGCAHQCLQFRLAFNGELVAQTPNRLHQRAAVSAAV